MGVLWRKSEPGRLQSPAVTATIQEAYQQANFSQPHDEPTLAVLLLRPDMETERSSPTAEARPG